MEVQESERKGYIYMRLCELCKLKFDRSSYLDKNVPTTLFAFFKKKNKKKVKRPFKLLSSGQKIPLTFILAHLHLELCLKSQIETSVKSLFKLTNIAHVKHTCSLPNTRIDGQR